MQNKLISRAVQLQDGSVRRINVTLANPEPLDQATGTISASAEDVRRIMAAPPTRNEPSQIEARKDSSCARCEGAGYFKEAVSFGHPHFGVLFPCLCKLAAEDDRARETRQSLLARLSDELGSRLMNCSFTNFTIWPDLELTERRSLQDAREAMKGYAASPAGWMYLYGPTGVGKSHLAAAAVLTMAERGIDVAYASVPKLLRFIKAGFSDGSTDARIAALMTVSVLVLDDLGAEHHRGTYDYNDAALFELINERELFNRATIITSNGPRSDLEPRIRSRITMQARDVHIDAPDCRERFWREREEQRDRYQDAPRKRAM